MKNKKNRGRLIIFLAIMVVIIILGIIILFFRHTDKVIKDDTENTIRLYINKTKFADVYVVNGSLDAEIANREADAKIQLLKTSIIEINEKETLSLIVEPELGLFIAAEISKNDSLFIYAVAEYFRDKGFGTEIVHTDYELKSGRLTWIECSDLYDKIDSDLQNANYCNIDSDCKTLPLAGPYIEFGCYHYINSKENSTLFYNRMNEYSAECGNIIDLCRFNPEPKCVSGKCVEAS